MRRNIHKLINEMINFPIFSTTNLLRIIKKLLILNLKSTVNLSIFLISRLTYKKVFYFARKRKET